jgi:hypothetical protein
MAWAPWEGVLISWLDAAHCQSCSSLFPLRCVSWLFCPGLVCYHPAFPSSATASACHSACHPQVNVPEGIEYELGPGGQKHRLLQVGPTAGLLHALSFSVVGRGTAQNVLPRLGQHCLQSSHRLPATSLL